MAIYIGGDTESLEYDFGLKVANSVAECPMKIYKGEVDADALPAPTDALWKEVTEQKILDKLKSQNELLTSNLAVDKSTIQWGDKTLSKTSAVKVVDDFVGKVSGSVVENANISKTNSSGVSLLAPNAFTYEISQSGGYDKIKTLDNTTSSVTSSIKDQIPQQLFSFNIIEIVERKFGTIPKETIAEKIEWLKGNLKEIVCNPYIYGNSPLGNRANFTIYKTSRGWDSWYSTNGIITSSTPTLAKRGTAENSIISDMIQPDGFVHFLAYTDKARTTDETLLVLTGHGLSTGDLVENFTKSSALISITKITDNTIIQGNAVVGQSSGDSISKYHVSSIKTTETGTTANTLKITNHGLSTGDVISNSSRAWAKSKIVVVDANTVTCSTSITGQTSGDTIYLYKFTGTQTAESTVIPSTIYTDYVSIELTLKAPENLITATNTLEDIVTDFSGKVAGSVTENANISKYRSSSTDLQVPSTFTSEISQNSTQGTANYSNLMTLDGNNSIVSSNANGAIPQQLFSFDIVKAVEKHLGQSIPSSDKVQWCKDNLEKIQCDWWGYGSCPGGNKAQVYIWNPSSSSWNNNYINPVTSNTPTKSGLTINKAGSSTYYTIPTFITNDGFVYLLVSTNASDGITPSVINTDYAKITIELKYLPTYDFYTDSNNRRDAGLTNIVLIKRSIGDMTSDFTGKVSGSVVENPNIFCPNNGYTTLQSPSNYSESTNYTGLDKLDNNCRQVSATANGAIATSLFAFNLIAIAEKQLGTSIPGADVASKVSWLKENLASIIGEWTGYGSCPSGNKAHLSIWYDSYWASASSNTASTSTKISKGGSSVIPYIQSDGMFYILAYTDASDGVTASVINTDYIKLTLTFKSDTVGYEFFTNNSSEISVTTNNKASAFLIECDLTPICNALYGGSNSALKSALKSIQADVWAMGSGANGNELGYGVKMDCHNQATSAWANLTTKNITSIISKINWNNSTASAPNYLTTLNKFYIIIYTQYKSNGVIQSEVNLDYVNIKVNLTRVPDVIAPSQVTVGDTWSMLIKGFSPKDDNTTKKQYSKVFELFIDDNNRYGIQWDTTGFILYKKVNASSIMKSSNAQIFSRFQALNFLLVSDANNLYLYLLKNAGVIEKYTLVDNRKLAGIMQLKPLMANNTNIYNGDAFLENLCFFNNKTFTDEEAEAILRGTKEGFENPNLVPLFNDSRWTKHANATVSADGKTLTLNATASWEVNKVKIPVLPNNKYKLTGYISGGKFQRDEYYNNYLINTTSNYYKGNASFEFTTSNKTNSVFISLTNGSEGAGTFTFSNLKLRRLD